MAKIQPHITPARVSLKFLRDSGKNRPIKGDGSTLKRIPARLLFQIQLDKEARGPSRLWFYIREMIGSKFYVHDAQQRAIVKAGGFSNYQIDKYLKFLVDNGYMYRDRKGNVYPLSLHFVCKKEVRENGKHKMTTHRQISVEEISDNEKWKKFLRGQVSLVASHISSRSSGGKKNAICYATHTIQGGGNTDYVCRHKGRTVPRSECATLSVCQGVSLQNLQMITGMSKSTMSRWRSQGQIAGYELYECFQPIGNEHLENLPLHKAIETVIEFGLAKEINPNLLRAIDVDGQKKVMMQAPSQIALREKIFFYA